jgi:cysteine synthase
MKAIVLTAIITGFSSKADKSLSFRGVTPELTSVEKVALMDLQGANVRLLIEPLDYETDGKVEVKAEVETKTPSERLRAVLFVLYKHENPNETFATFYTAKIEKVIEHVKSKLPEQ